MEIKNLPETDSKDFRNMVEPMARNFDLQGKLGLEVTLKPDASRSLARYVMRLATMLDLQADMLATEERIREHERRLRREYAKLAGGIALWVSGIALLNWVASNF